MSFSASTWRLLAVGWTLTILLACSIPGSSLPTVTFNLLAPDKVAHILLFAVFGILWMQALPRSGLLRPLLVIIAGVGYGIFIEVFQGLLPWERQPDLYDVVADAVGLGLAFVLHALGQRWRRGQRA